MTEDIKMLKTKVMQFMDQEVNKYGNGRMDVKQVGELADVIKDLAEAEYYCTVAEAMNEGKQDTMGYTPMNRMEYGRGRTGGTSGRQGYNSGMMGHMEPVAILRDMLSTANPEMRAQIRNELSGLMSM